MGRWEPGTRSRLAQAGLALFEERGYEQTTVADIAAAAGLTERTFFRYFADKREVLFEGSAVLAESMVAAVVAGTVATAVGIGHPYWATVAAVAPLSAPAAGPRLLRAAHRIVGTLLGLGGLIYAFVTNRRSTREVARRERAERELAAIKAGGAARNPVDELRARFLDRLRARDAGAFNARVDAAMAAPVRLYGELKTGDRY